jgi:YVTN family beta-propeller protein
VIDTTANIVIGDPVTVGTGPFGVAIDQGLHRAYVTNSGRYSSSGTGGATVSVIDTTTNTGVGTPIRVGADPMAVAIDQGLHRAYVVSQSSVSVIDTTLNTVVGSIAGLGNYPYGLAIDQGTHTAYVTDFNDNFLSVIDTNMNTLVARVPTGATSGAQGVAVDQSTHAAYVANHGTGSTSTVSVIQQVETAETTTSVASSGNPTVWVPTTLTASVSLKPDGGSVAFTDNGAPITGCGPVAVADGKAVCSTTFTTAGDHPIVASYSGKTGFAASVSPATSVQVAPVPPVATMYTATAPCRLFDTRGTTSVCAGASAVPVSPMGAGGSLRVKVAGVNGIPWNATAVALNLTGVNAAGPTFVTAYPSGGTQPLASALNLTTAAPLANSQVVAIGSDGYIVLTNFSGKTDLLADVQGSFAPNTGVAYTPTVPCRLFDTRGSATACAGADPVAVAPVGTGAPLRVKVAGVNGIPTGVSAVALNLTGVGASGPTFVTAYPSGETKPVASSLNLSDANPGANFQLVAVGADGYVNLSNFSGTTDLLADVQGYYANVETGTLYTATAPCRVFDTRSTPTTACTGAQPVPVGALGTNGTVRVKVAGVNNIPVGVKAVSLNLTAVDATGSTYVTAYPDGTPKPLASTVNLNNPDPLAHLVTVAVAVGGDGYVAITNFANTTNLLADIRGYYT